MEFLDKLLNHFNLTYEEYLELSKDINEDDLPKVNNFKNVDIIIKRIFKAIENSFDLGHGIGPLGHFVEIYKRLGIKY